MGNSSVGGPRARTRAVLEHRGRGRAAGLVGCSCCDGALTAATSLC